MDPMGINPGKCDIQIFGYIKSNKSTKCVLFSIIYYYIHLHNMFSSLNQDTPHGYTCWPRGSFVFSSKRGPATHGDQERSETQESFRVPPTKRKVSRKASWKDRSHRIYVMVYYTYIWSILMVNVGKYTIHGSFAVEQIPFQPTCCFFSGLFLHRYQHLKCLGSGKLAEH